MDLPLVDVVSVMVWCVLSRQGEGRVLSGYVTFCCVMLARDYSGLAY